MKEYVIKYVDSYFCGEAQYNECRVHAWDIIMAIDNSGIDVGNIVSVMEVE